VEDLDLGYRRPGQRGWPRLYVAAAVASDRPPAHRANHPRANYTDAQLERILEVNYLKFLVRAVATRSCSASCGRQATRRLRTGVRPALLSAATRIALGGGSPGVPEYSRKLIWALTSGAVAVFPGQIVSVRQRAFDSESISAFSSARWRRVSNYNLMRRVGIDFDPVLLAFTKRLATPPPEILGPSRPSGSWCWRSPLRPLSAPPCTKPCASGGRPWRTSRLPKWRSTPPIARQPRTVLVDSGHFW